MRNACAVLVAGLLATVATPVSAETPNRAELAASVKASHATNLKRLQDWIALPTIAAEKRGTPEGAEHMRKLLLDAGFQQAKIVPTSRRSGRVRDARCRRSDHARHLLHVRREAVRSRPNGRRRRSKGGSSTGPKARRSWAAARSTRRGRRTPSCRRFTRSRRPAASCRSTSCWSRRARRRSPRRTSTDHRHSGSAGGDGEGRRRLHPGRRAGIDRRDLDRPRRQGRGRDPADFERRELGPRARPRTSTRACTAIVDSPAWRLVKALDTLVKEDGHTPAVEGWFENVKPLTARQKELIAEGVPRGTRRRSSRSSASSSGSTTRIS